MKERCRALLQEHGIGHAFFHAPLDGADFGTSASLAHRLGARITARSNPYRDVFYCGRIGEFDPPLDFEGLRQRLQEVLGEPVRAWQHHDRPIRRVCITTGGGFMTGEVAEAVKHGCDAYITGEKLLYTVQYARFAGIDLLVGSHTFTECFGVGSLAEKIRQQFPEVELVRLHEEHLE
jgi:putative NIF3 family GTP cyclohydrolase 1 type 2